VVVLRPARMAEVVLLLVGRYKASFADMVKLSNHASSAEGHTVFVLMEGSIEHHEAMLAGLGLHEVCFHGV